MCLCMRVCWGERKGRGGEVGRGKERERERERQRENMWRQMLLILEEILLTVMQIERRAAGRP